MARDRMEQSIEIEAPPDKVWELLAWDRMREWEKGWQDNVRQIEYTSEVQTNDDKYRVGASAHIALKRGEFEVEITECREHETLVYRVKGAYSGTMAYSLEPVEGGTKFTYVADIEIPGGFLGRVLARAFKGAGERDFATSLTNLKKLAEAQVNH